MRLLNIDGRFLNMDLIIEVQRDDAGTVTVVFAASGQGQTYRSVFDGRAGAALMRWLESNATFLFIEVPTFEVPPLAVPNAEEAPSVPILPTTPFLG